MYSSSFSGGLYPPLFNVVPRAQISVNATCGQNGAEEYCKQVGAKPCGICNAHSSDRAKQRSIQSLISSGSGSGFEEGWWQSPTLQGGRQFEYVTILLDLKQVSQTYPEWSPNSRCCHLSHPKLSGLSSCDRRAVIQFVIKPLSCHSFTSDLTPAPWSIVVHAVVCLIGTWKCDHLAVETGIETSL